MNWIPTDEKLPEIGTKAIVCGKNGGIFTATHTGANTWLKLNRSDAYLHPIAWMPLPEPYKMQTE